jgi:hypothetical protein
MNPALIEMMATDRSTELRAAAAKRAPRGGVSVPTEPSARATSARPGRRAPLANPQREVGWFLVSVGLRLALPRTRTGPAR